MTERKLSDLTELQVMLLKALAEYDREFPGRWVTVAQLRSEGRLLVMGAQNGVPGLAAAGLILKDSSGRVRPTVAGLKLTAEGLCAKMLGHPDDGEYPCVLEAAHRYDDSPHADEHGCVAPVIISRGTLIQAQAIQDEQNELEATDFIPIDMLPPRLHRLVIKVLGNPAEHTAYFTSEKARDEFREAIKPVVWLWRY